MNIAYAKTTGKDSELKTSLRGETPQGQVGESASSIYSIPQQQNLSFENEAEDEEEIICQAMVILELRMRVAGEPMNSPSDMKRFLKLKLARLEHEVFLVMFLDNQHRLISYEEMFRGTIDGASVHPREVVKRALAVNSAALIFAHNHPSGISEPSQADQRITQRLKAALELVDIRVLDHFIVGDAETLSFAERGLI